MLKEILSSLFWGAALFVVQIVVDLAKHEPIDWQTTILASVFLIVIHFFITRGRKTIEDGPKKNAIDPKEGTKSIAQKAKRKINDSKSNQETEPSAMEKRGYDKNDLKFYLYHRNSKLCVIAGIVCLLLWYLQSRAWFFYVGISFLLLAIVYYIFFLLKRKEFVEKQRKEIELKNSK